MTDLRKSAGGRESRFITELQSQRSESSLVRAGRAMARAEDEDIARAEAALRAKLGLAEPKL